MRVLMVVLAASAALAACGQPASNVGEASAQGNVAANAHTEFVDRCVSALVAANPNMRDYAPAQCEQEWQMIVDAGPMAEAILAAAPVSGAADPATVRTRLTMVRWDARAEATLLASGRLSDDVRAQVDRSGANLMFSWGETGALIPYDAIGALRVRGAEPAMVGCVQMGVGEFNRAYRVTAPGRAPFMVMVYDRTAPTANAESFYTVSLDLSGQVRTLAQLRRDGDDWAAACAY